jgi:DNA-binding beta-propeller fold protein YncE
MRAAPKRSSTLVLALALLISCQAEAQDGPYRLVREIAIGGEGGWDYLSVDPAAHRLFVSHGNRIVVIDTQQDKIAGEITDTPGVHGLTLAPDLGRGFVANGGDNTVSIVDLASLVVSTDRYHQGRRETILAAITSNVGRLLVGNYKIKAWRESDSCTPQSSLASSEQSHTT